jgi:hypothetical protein
MARLNDNEVREVARMQRVIDTLTSAIYALCEVANGNEKTVAIRFDCDCEEMDAIGTAYGVIYKKLVGREKG